MDRDEPLERDERLERNDDDALAAATAAEQAFEWLVANRKLQHVLTPREVRTEQTRQERIRSMMEQMRHKDDA